MIKSLISFAERVEQFLLPATKGKENPIILKTQNNDTWGVIYDKILEDVDFSQNILNGQKMINKIFVNCDFSELDGKDMQFVKCGVRKSLFIKAYLKNSTFIKCDLKETDFTNACLEGVDFSGSDLRGVIFTGACLKGTLFYNTDLRGAVFNNSLQDWPDPNRFTGSILQ
jgi:uncharacterized protein YjbI with pentapeptide repeats